MKRSFLLIALLFCISGLRAQTEKQPQEPAKDHKVFNGQIARHPVVFGIRGGINFNSFGADAAKVWDSPVKEKTHIGWNIGLVIDVPILESFYFQTGLFFKSKGFKLAESNDDYSRQIKAKPRFLQFPLLFSYRYQVKRGLQFEFNAGPYVACGIGGKVTDYVYEKQQKPGLGEGFNPDYIDNKDPKITEREVFGDNLEESFGIKKTDIGLAFGIGMTVNRFYFGFQYDLGLTNLRNDVCWANRTSFHTRSATILMGFQLFRY